jgi:hypothetical protein
MNNCVYLRIAGGLGNQLFQYSYALACARSQQRKLIINTYYQNQFIHPLALGSAKREFVLDKIGILAKDVTLICRKEKYILDKMFKLHVLRCRTIREIINKFNFVDYLDDYYCSAKDFGDSQKIVPEIKAIYHERNNIQKESGEACFVHVRAGDLLNQPSNPKCSRDYYENGFKEMEKRDIRKFSVITENVEYAKTLLPKAGRWQIDYQEPDTETNDFKSLTKAKYIISANSTFSWWAAILSECDVFVSPPFFYRYGDKPNVQENEIIVNH